jgi:hypothetical protein
VNFIDVDEDGWIGTSATFTAPAFDTFKVMKIDLENPGAAAARANQVQVRLNGQARETIPVARADYASLTIPLTAGEANTVELRAAQVFPLPNDGRERSLLIKNLAFENVSPTDLFVRGWHRSGYQFHINQADNDGWVDRTIAFRFPATERFQHAIVQLVRYPAVADLPIAMVQNGERSERVLGLETTETIRVPLSSNGEATLSLSASRSYPLAAPDTRSRSFRLVNVDFE